MTTRGRDGGGEPPYTGAVGATRYDAAFVTGKDGVSRRIEIARAVNVATDPVLRSAAIEGTLHRLDDGTYLAVPYVFHDPAARKFALVIPVARSHEELTLRAALLQSLAADTSAPLPAYVREARTVIGIDALQAYLSEQPENREAAAEIESKMEAVSHREERLRDRAEEVTRREDELHQRVEEIDLARSDLSVREQEFEQRLADVVAREEALAGEERAMLANKNALQGRERLLDAREETLVARERELDAREAELAERASAIQASASRPSFSESLEPLEMDAYEVGAEMPDDEVEEATPLPGPLPTAEPVEVFATNHADPAALESRGPGQRSGETMEAEVAEGEFESAEPEELHPATDLDESPESIDAGDAIAEESAEEESSEIEPEPHAPSVPPAWAARGRDVYAAVVDGEVRLWAGGGSEMAARLAQGSTALVLQVDPESKLPLALLGVVALPSGERLARAILDVTRPDDRAVIETLGRDFRVRLEVVSPGGRALGSYAVADQCEANAQRALVVLSARDAGSEEARRAESERMSREGVVSLEGDQFGRAFADEAALGAVEGVERAVAAYIPLLDPKALDRFVLSRGVPSARVDGFGKRLILAALRCGVELPKQLIDRALEAGLAPDEKSLAARAMMAFARTCDGGLESIGRTPSDAASAWAKLLAWGDRLGVEVPEAVLAALKGSFDPDDPDSIEPPDPRPAPEGAAIQAMSDDDLGKWADHPGVRETVAREMIRRKAARFAEPLARTLRVSTPEAAAELAAAMTAAGDDLGDVWVELLGSRKTPPRVFAAVACASIRLRRGLNPLVQRALAPNEPEWRIHAWAAGDFGTAAVRAISRMDHGDPERIGWILAHAVRAGAGRDVEKTRSSTNKILAEAATRAVGRVDEARAFDAAMRHGGGHTDGERWAHLMLTRIDRPEKKSGEHGAAREG